VSKYTGKLFVLYGGREQTGDAAGVENAPILATAITESQAQELGHWFRDCVWWEYDVSQGQIVGGTQRLDMAFRRGSARRSK